LRIHDQGILVENLHGSAGGRPKFTRQKFLVDWLKYHAF